MDFILLMLWSVQYGLIEQWIYRQGFKTRKEKILKYFSVYHLMMLGLFLVTIGIAGFVGNIKYFPIMILVEDLSYFFFHPGQELKEESWVNFGLGGFRIMGKWIPWKSSDSRSMRTGNSRSLPAGALSA